MNKTNDMVGSALLLVRNRVKVAIATLFPETFVERFAPYPDVKVEVKSWGVELKLREDHD